MKRITQIILLSGFIMGTIATLVLLYLFNVISIPNKPLDIALWSIFFILFITMCNEGFNWVKNGKRSDIADLIAILFFGIVVYLFTRNIMTSVMGAFSIYLIFGIFELKDYEILDKLLLITVITYNVIFLCGILDIFLFPRGITPQKDFLVDTAFSMSFLLMLILGFIIFGRKYMVVFRFMSAQYLSLVFYIVAWMGVATFWRISEIDISKWIYEIVIGLNIIIYIFSGKLLDWMMGYKKIDNPELQQIINDVARDMGLNPKRIKVRYGKYPILNAMAYGCYGLDMHMAIIAPELKFGKGSIGKDEIRGIIAHEFGHLRGKHTLILTLIISIQILIFQILGWPATMYDYTFNPGHQPFDLWVFVLINIGISIILYIFVRNLESRADLAARRAGYRDVLAKGLYNLESFYASSHEVGLDATLLSDEKISDNNRMLNYFTTAQYLNRNMINPKKGTLLSNLINSHPPSYHRILAQLNQQEINPQREALLPFTLLSKKKARKFLIETNDARKNYLILVNKKIEEEFGISTIEICNKILLKEEYNYKIGKTFAFRNRSTSKKIFGKIEAIKYQETAPQPLQYTISLCNSTGNEEGKSFSLNPALYDEVPVEIGGLYRFKKEGWLNLVEIDLTAIYWKENKIANKKRNGKSKNLKKVQDEDFLFKNLGVLKFQNQKGETIQKALFNSKIPKPQQYFKEFENRQIFLREKGSYRVLTLNTVEMEDYSDSVIFNGFQYGFQSKAEILNKSNYTIRFTKPYFELHNDAHTYSKEKNLIEFFKETKQRVYCVLKKAVNSEIDGWIEDIEYSSIENSSKKTKESTNQNLENKIKSISIRSVFDESFTLEMGKIDGIILNQPNLLFQKKSDISSVSMLFHKWARFRHPDRISL
ncbi:MAG: M48 family metalloprotease [Promethearchaeota archaeon]